MSDEAALPEVASALTESVSSDAPPPAETARSSVAESLAATFDRIQEREGNAPGQRAQDGKFQPRQAPVVAAPGAPTTDQPATEGNEPPPAAIEAPQSWSAEMKAQFATLPPDAQKYVAQRESEAHAKISDQGNRLKAFDGLSHVLEPRRAELMASYGSVEKGLSDLMALHARYHTDPVSVIVGLAQGAGIRLDQLPQLAQQAPPQAQRVDPHVAALHNEVAALKSTITTQAYGEAEKIVEAFKAKPENKHYAAVEPRIAELINSGVARDLPTAYKMAVRENDTLLEQDFAERATAAKAKADAEAKRLADEARKANVVNIRTPGARASGGPASGTIRSSLERAYDKVNGAA